MCDKCEEEVVKRLYNDREGKSGKIFCLINSGKPNWYHVIAVSEEGLQLAGHLSSTEGFARHDIGITSDCKHDKYKKHYPGGFELVWIELDAEPPQALTDAVESMNKMVDDTCICGE